MHFEVPKIAHSLREFAAHYVMIVVSILTALGLEATIEHFHHAHAAEAARQSIESELRANLADIRTMNTRNLARIGPMETIAKGLVDELAQGTPEARIRAQIAALVKAHIDLGIFMPTLRHEAWDVAVANQSAAYIEPDTLRRLSAAYAAQREIASNPLMPLFNGPRYMDALTDAEVGIVDPHEFLRVMRQAITTLQGAHSNYMELEKEIRDALPADAAPPAAGGASSPAPASASSS